MSKVVIGIDPGAVKHGVAVYVDGVLSSLHSLNSVGIVELVKGVEGADLLFSIEDVKANKFIYERNEKPSKAAQSKVGMSVGRNQQAQIELLNWLDHLGVPYRLHRPQIQNWAKDKARFEKITGWRGKSNKDTRSAAFFGFLEVGRCRRNARA